MLIARIEDYKGYVRMAYPKKDESDAQFISRLNNNFTYKLNGIRSIKFIEPLDADYNKRSFNYNKSTINLDWNKILSKDINR
jgi:hypothetical protein